MLSVEELNELAKEGLEEMRPNLQEHKAVLLQAFRMASKEDHSTQLLKVASEKQAVFYFNAIYHLADKHKNLSKISTEFPVVTFLNLATVAIIMQ